jgi:Uncharacterized protein conserved in bacteria
MDWKARQPDLERMAAEGMTGSQIAAALGTTRNAVLGRAHRTGVVLPETNEKKAAAAERLAIIVSRPEVRAKITAAMRDPATRAAIGAKARARFADPSFREALRAAGKLKLTDEQAAEIRSRAMCGEKQGALAVEFGVSQTVISQIKTGKLHKHAKAA